MHNEAFEEIVKSQKDLNLLINEKKFGIFCKIKKTDKMTPEFIDWISPKYLESLEFIYEKHIKFNPAIIGGVLRMSFLANSETKKKLDDVVKLEFTKSLEAGDTLSEMANTKTFDMKTGLDLLKDMFSVIPLSMFRNFDEPFVHDFKKELTNKCLEIADKMKGLKSSRHMEQFVVYEDLLARLKKLNIGTEGETKLKGHEKNVRSKNTVALVIGIILALVAVVRLMMTVLG